MPGTTRTPADRPETARKRGIWPRTTLGWVALVGAVLSVVSWIVFPVLTMNYRSAYPVLDTAVMPAISIGLLDLTALLGLGAVWLKRDRATMSIVVLIFSALVGVFLTLSLFVGPDV